jgi:hypothetical protein
VDDQNHVACMVAELFAMVLLVGSACADVIELNVVSIVESKARM